MKALAVALALMGAAGCSTQTSARYAHLDPTPAEKSEANRLLVKEIQDESVAQATIEMATVLPHYFKDGSGQLNALGERTLAILAAHYCGGARGGLNVRQGGVEHEIYVERLETVRLYLANAGVPDGTVSIVDGTTSGTGMPTPRVLLNQQRLDGEEGEE